jgi:hypothetical protein
VDFFSKNREPFKNTRAEMGTRRSQSGAGNKSLKKKFGAGNTGVQKHSGGGPKAGKAGKAGTVI